ncbi:hypothetical protein AB0B03_22205 [Micromonospora chalcea]
MIELRDGSIPELCALCKRLVFGLKGQDCYLAPWVRRFAPDNLTDLHGPVHLLCLRELSDSFGWGIALERYAESRYSEAHQLGNGWKLFSSSGSGQVFLWSDSGWFADADLSVFRNRAERGAGDGSLLRVDSVVGYEGGPYEAIFDRVAVEEDEGCALLELIERAGVRDRLVDEKPLVGGVVELRSSPRDKSGALPREYLARHHMTLPPEVAEGCYEISRRPRFPATRRRR